MIKQMAGSPASRRDFVSPTNAWRCTSEQQWVARQDHLGRKTWEVCQLNNCDTSLQRYYAKSTKGRCKAERSGDV
jgi:hypothetical protein